MEQMPVRLQEVDYYPKVGEFFVIAGTVAVLICLGYIIRQRWTRKNDTVPFSVTLLMWFGMVVLYLLMSASLFEEAAETHKLTVLGWCLLFWMIPVGYFSLNVVNSLAMRSVDRIGPFSAHIEDPSEFAAARKLALRGDIDGAVSMYRSYTENQHSALFEAARLLKSEDRYAEAATLLQEIAERFKHINRIWAEASYQLAKLKETNLREPREAMILLRAIMKQAPETRFYQLAGADLSRMQVMDSSFLEELAKEEAQAQTPERDPFFVPKSIPPVRPEGVVSEETPPPDPFFPTTRQQEEGSTQGASVSEEEPVSEQS